MAKQISLEQALRTRGTPGVTGLLRTRPDLARPIPRSLDDLVERSLTVASTTRALAGLAPRLLRVLMALAAELPTELLPVPADGDQDEALAHLTDRGLVWGDPPHCSEAVRRLLGPYPAGLAPASTQPLTDDRVAAALQVLRAADRAVLDRLAWGPPIGAVADADRRVRLQDAESPIDRLLALGLLRPLDAGRVILPREVAIELRGGRVFDPESGRPDLPSFAVQIEDAAHPTVQPVPSPAHPEPSPAHLDHLAAWLLGQGSTEVGWLTRLRTAAEQDRWVFLSHANEDGTVWVDEVRVLTIAQGSAYLVRRAGRRFSVPLRRVVDVQVTEPVVINDLASPDEP